MYRREFEANTQAIAKFICAQRKVDMIEIGQADLHRGVRQNIRKILTDAGIPAADLPEKDEELLAMIDQNYHQPESKNKRKKERAGAKAAKTA